jgi:hypothetical protein
MTLLKGLGETLERVTPALEKLSERANDAPAQAAVQASAPEVEVRAQGIEDQASTAPAQGRILSFEDQLEVRSALRKRSVNELHRLFAYQASQNNKGIPLEAWLYAGGTARQDLWGNAIGRELSPEIQKLLDTGGAAPVIRQDLEPILYELFVREFPAFDMFAKEPANGLTHTYQQTTSFGDAQFMAELGTVTDDVSAYARQTTNIAILATRRGVSLKSQFATLQSGSGFNPEQLEMTGGLRAIAHRMQAQIFSGHATDSGGTAANELGLYNANAFTGLRSILNSGRVKYVDPHDNGATAGSMRTAWNQACVEIMQISPGRPNVIFLNPIDKEVFDAAQDTNVRYQNELVNVAVGVNTNVVNTVFGALPLFPIPGDAIGAYTATTPAEEVRDSYILDMSSISLPYLGSEGITTLEIPVGVSGQLTKLYILFGMWGLAANAPTYSNKVRITTS